MNDDNANEGERPLGLRELAEVDSPEIVRAALRRFRRRTAIRALWIAGALLVATVILPFLRGRTTVDRFAHAPGELTRAVVSSGPIHVLLLETKRLDKDSVGLHILTVADGLRPDEQLAVNPDPSHFLPPPLTFRSALRGVRQVTQFGTPRSRGVVEQYLILYPGTRTIEIGVSAALPAGPGEEEETLPRGPRPMTEEDFLFPYRPGTFRRIGTVVIDLQTLGVPATIWR